MGKSKAPPPPDPRETSAASTSTNVGTAVANAFLGNVNQVTPDGSLTYDQTDTYTWNDPYTGKSYEIPRFTATQTLSDNQQAIKDETDSAQFNLAGLANEQSGQLRDHLATPIDLSTENVQNYINTHHMDDFDKQWNNQKSDYETQLSNQGIKLGSDAYTRAMSEFSDNRSNARDNLYGNMYGQAQNSISGERNQKVNEISALLSGSQVSQPNYVNTSMPNIATTDVAGIINNEYAQRLGIWQQEQAQKQGLLGGLFGLGASIISSPAFSDRRVKKDIKPVGKLEGHKLYEYRYKDEPADAPKHTGVMAQEVEKKRPDAVLKNENGIRMVDYGSLFGLGENQLMPDGKSVKTGGREGQQAPGLLHNVEAQSGPPGKQSSQRGHHNLVNQNGPRSYQQQPYYGDDLSEIKGRRVPVGRVSSARYPGQFGAIPVGYETNALDVAGDIRQPVKPSKTFDFHGVEIVKRDEWAQYPPDLTGRDPLEPDRTPNVPYNKITVHHSGWYTTPQGVEKRHRNKENIVVRSIRLLPFVSDAMNKADVGYDFMIGKDGTIYQGRDLKYEGAHAISHNTDNISISFLGNYTSRELTDKQMASLERLLEALNLEYSQEGKMLPVYSHGYYNSKKNDELRGAQTQLSSLGVIFDQPDVSP